jgi:hypothetical protein
MVAVQDEEEVWTKEVLGNPANITHRLWKKADIAAQDDVLRNVLVLGKIPGNISVFLLKTQDGTAVVLREVEPTSVTGLGEDQARNFLAWDTLSPEAAFAPSAHWRLAYLITAHDDGTVDITAVEVAPDRAKYHSRPRPSLP